MSKIKSTFSTASSAQIAKISFELTDGSTIVLDNIGFTSLDVEIIDETSKRYDAPMYEHAEGIDVLRFSLQCKGVREALYSLLRIHK